MANFLTIVGTRPQFIKAATVSRAFKRRELAEILVHTGQHYDEEMSQIFFDDLKIPKPKYNIDVHGGGHGSMTGRMLLKLEEIIIREKPDVVLVYGDTNSTLAGALAAAKLNIPVAHIEAGLRSFNRRMPEEINRVVADHVSTYLFCPTNVSVENLQTEGVNTGVYHVGDVMYDATRLFGDIAQKSSAILEKFGLTGKEFSLATVHRAENTDDPDRLREIVEFLEETAQRQILVLLIHPRTRRKLKEFGISPDAVRVENPVGYLDMLHLLGHASRVFTDSGGLQKEAYFYRVPCLTLRDETEWVETVEAGWNRLWKSRTPELARRDIDDYGNGNAAAEIVDILLNNNP